ncbi:hypothetical protein QR680_018825 [Steinernema hermaphroditum]|uniref:Protein kinase domain-containing protein n=1 Tax=Steinernema hermaphroditum TaxID=289476 RepID=A0AA39LRB9_9BILA|nr:hypothetical protein QR680_018825 [Steinernema hermaphroditum]
MQAPSLSFPRIAHFESVDFHQAVTMSSSEVGLSLSDDVAVQRHDILDPEAVVQKKLFFFANVNAEFVERNVLLERGDFCLWKSDNFAHFFSVRREDDAFFHLCIQKSEDEGLVWFSECPAVKLSSVAALVRFFCPETTVNDRIFPLPPVNFFSSVFEKQHAIPRRLVNPRDIGMAGNDVEIFLHQLIEHNDDNTIYTASVVAKDIVHRSTVKRMSQKDAKTRERLLTEFCTLKFLHDQLRNKCIQRINAMDVKEAPFLVAYAEANWVMTRKFIGSSKWKKLSEAQKIDMAIELASTLHDMRTVGVLHCHLNLDTIVVRENGRFMITDFAEAIRLDVSDEKRNVELQTEAWGPVQPLNYRNPQNLPLEVMETKAFRINTDVFALGLFLFEFFTGQSPFGDKSQEETTKAFVRRSLHPKIRMENGRLEALLKRCCAAKPHERPNFKGVLESLSDLQK